MDYKFTANMEIELDEIRNGKKEWTKVLKTHYDLFSPQVQKIKKDPNKYKTSNSGERILGKDPETDVDIIATTAKYGAVIKKQIGNNKFVYAPIKKPLTLETIELKQALKLFEYPKNLGKYLKKEIILNKGEHNLYLRHGLDTYSLGDDHKGDIDLDDAIEFIEKKKKEKEKLNKAYFESDKMTYSIREGQYGHFVLTKEKKRKVKQI